VVQRIADRLGQGGTAGDALELLTQPDMQRLDQRAAALLAHMPTFVSGLAADVSLDRVERGDASQRLGGELRPGGLMNVVKFPPRMGPAKSQPWPVIRCHADQATEAGIAIDLEQSTEALQVAGRVLTFAILTIDIGSRWMAWPTPRPIVDRIAPQPPGLGASPSGVQHRQRRVIGEHLGRTQHGAEQQFVQRRQPPAGTADPVTQRGPIQRDALSGEDLRLPVQREMVGVFADQHVRQHRLGRHAAVDRPFRRRCLDHRLPAGPAAIFGAANDPDPQMRRNKVEHLGDVFTDPMQRAVAAGAGLVLDIDDYLVACQMHRQRAAVALHRIGARLAWWCLRGRGLCLRSLRRRCSRRQSGLMLGQGLLQILHAPLERLGVELFRAAAEPVALQAGDLQPQALDLGGRRQQELAQRGRVVR
jgi:hypothetical protein